MCDCRTNLEARLLDSARQQLPNSTNHKVDIQGYAFVMSGGTMVMRQSIPVEIQHTVIVKKTGLPKRKTEKTNLLASYCMFCGEKQNSEQE